MEQKVHQSKGYEASEDLSSNSLMQPFQHHHHHHHHLPQSHHHGTLPTVHSNPMPMSSVVGLPVECSRLASASSSLQLQASKQNSCHLVGATASCPQHQIRPQQQQRIYNQIYQSLQTYHPSAFQGKIFTAADDSATVGSEQQHLFVNTNRHNIASDIDRHSNLSLQPQQLYHQLQHYNHHHSHNQAQQSQLAQPLKSASMLATISSQVQAEKSSVLSTQFTRSTTSPTVTASTSSVGTSVYNQWQQGCRNGAAKAADCKATTSQRSKLVDSSFSSAATSSTSSSTTREGKFKSYLAHLILASNIPFAYAIIMVAFLITFIAATSIITILTIVLTITGYTAYPITENAFNFSLAIGVVCASLALALVTASLIVWRRHCQAAYYYLDDPQSASRGTNSPQLSETYDDSEYGSVPVNEWAKHVQKLHADSDIGFSREFEQVQKANSANLTSVHSQLAENKQKNRYINIVAYDHTRVTLRVPPGQKKPGSDYINANFIDGYNKPRAYIGTQGPLVSTFDDYWRMIWEQRVMIIVMITNLQERGRRKCDMYWPKEGTETYGHVQVQLLQEVVMATYTLRTFRARNLKMKKKSGSERTVYQYHYTNWPDHGVPDHPLPVLSFVRKSASANQPTAGAIICHCSAGCGRSGTYIVIDAMLKQIRHRQSINVVDFLKHIRSQRNYLVQTEEQYIFIHDALVEAIESGETEIASNFIAKYIQLLQTGGTGSALPLSNQKNSSCSIAANGLTDCRQQALSVSGTEPSSQLINSHSNLMIANGANNNVTKPGNTNTTGRSVAGQWSLLERQYRLVASFKAKDFNVVSALKPCNKNKNRTLNLIPLEAHRVHITPKPGADGSDYINATFIMGFNHLREFILTQHPVQDTFSDFWQMVYDHNSQTIVLLTHINDLEGYSQFWPQKEDEVDYGSFKVKLIQETTLLKSADEIGSQVVARDFIMRSNQDDYELQTRLIHCPGWPECCGPLSKVFDLIQVVQNATQQQASRQRMHDGHTATTTVTIGQEHEPQNGGPIIVVDKFGGTEAATFAVLTTLFKQINFEDAVDVYMYAKLTHLRRPGIWSSQDDYLFLYRAIENYASSIMDSNANMLNATPTNNPLFSPGTNFHHQTMTLDRHKHKSASLLKGTSTMRRPAHGNGHSGAQVANFTNEFSKSNSQLPVDHNHNQIITNVPAMTRTHLTSTGAPNALSERGATNLMQQHQLKSGNQQGGGSPYSSAGSMGAGQHQHLLPGTVAGRGLRTSQQRAQAIDHYLYPVS